MDKTAFIANVGDSRAVLSSYNGVVVSDLSRDHKPGDKTEERRIVLNGGEVYQTHTLTKVQGANGKVRMIPLYGPYRVFPGRLSVSRAFGDIEAKQSKFGGNPRVLICKPDIETLDLGREDLDFILLGCDGIFEKLTSRLAVEALWKGLRASKGRSFGMDERRYSPVDEPEQPES